MLLTKLLAGTSLGYFAYRYFKFRPATQILQVQRHLHKAPDIHIDQSVRMLDRYFKFRFLTRFLKGMPSGPLIVVGPNGSGKSVLMKRVLSGRKITFYVDFRKEPVTTGEEFMGIFVDNTGYVIPTPNELTKILYREEQRKNKITPHEAEMALDVITEVLKREKANGWRHGVPVICLDDFHVNFRLDKQGDMDPFWMKFLDWSLHIADSKLAHVVIVPSMAFATESLDSYAPLRAKRIQLFIDYPRKEQVRSYLNDVIALVYKNNESITHDARKQMVTWIVNCIGGQLEDLDQVLTALRRGDQFGSVLRRMITDSVALVEEKLEAILQQADTTDSKISKEDVFNKYLRLWKLIETLRDNDYINRRELVRLIFNEHVRELGDHVREGLATYVIQKPIENDPPVAIEDAPTQIQEQQQYSGLSYMDVGSHRSTEPTAANHLGGASWWDRVFGPTHPAPAEKAAPTVALPQPIPVIPPPVAIPPPATPAAALPSAGATSAAGVVAAAAAATPTPTTATPATSASTTTTKENEEDLLAYNSMLNSSLDSVLVSAGSPRIRIAFDLLIKDPRLIEQKKSVQLFLKLKSVKDRMEKIEQLKRTLVEERSNIVKELDMYVAKSQQYKDELGPESLEARIRRVMNYETQIDAELAQHDKTLEELFKQKQEIEAEGKLTQRKI